MSAPKGLEDFLGVWRLKKVIDDRLSGRPMTFSGTAVFLKDPQGVVYAEKGEMSVDGSAPLPATRTYFWRDGPAGHIDVLFDDERPFHRFSLIANPAASHFCDPDTYKVVYDFGAWLDWSCVWSVKGPKKDYRMEARYVRKP